MKVAYAMFGVAGLGVILAVTWILSRMEDPRLISGGEVLAGGLTVKAEQPDTKGLVGREEGGFDPPVVAAVGSGDAARPAIGDASASTAGAEIAPTVPVGATRGREQNPLRASNAGSSGYQQTEASAQRGAGAAVDTSAGGTSTASGAGQPFVADVQELAIPVPLGARVPVAALDDNPGRTPQQQKALDDIIRDFNEEVAGSVPPTPNPGPTPELPDARPFPPNTGPILDAWRLAQQRADNRYRTLFGFAAYEALHRRAALEALEEQRRVESGP